MDQQLIGGYRSRTTVVQVALMTATFAPLAYGIEFVLYDGTNGADVVAGLAGATLVSDTGGVVDFVDHQSTAQQFTAPWCLFRNPDGTFGGASATPDGFLKLAEIVQQYAATGVALVSGVGTASVPASLLGNAGVDYDVTLSPAMPSVDYVPVVQLRGAPNVVSGHGILSAAVIDVDTVRVTVQSGAASLAGATVRVTAHALAAVS